LRNGLHNNHHAIYTAAFIEYLKKDLPYEFNSGGWGEGDAFINLAAGHHNPKTPMQQIISVANCLASGMNSDEFNKSEKVSIQNYKKTRLLPLFEQLKKPEMNDFELFSYVYSLKPLSPVSIFPEERNKIQKDDATQKYKKLFDGFTHNLKILRHKNENLALWFDHFESLIMIYTSVISAARVKAVEYESFISHLSQSHNTINRLTQTTGDDNFAPYTKENIYYYPETKLVLFVLIDENITDIDQIRKGLENIGKFGFGRDASIGLGRFAVCESNEINVAVPKDANACYLLAPCVPEKDRFERMYFTPFIRFGKHEDRLANAGNPFKNPVVMADEGAVFISKNKGVFDKPYGRAVTGVSKAEPSSVVQGYAPYLPLKLEH